LKNSSKSVITHNQKCRRTFEISGHASLKPVFCPKRIILGKSQQQELCITSSHDAYQLGSSSKQNSIYCFLKGF